MARRKAVTAGEASDARTRLFRRGNGDGAARLLAAGDDRSVEGVEYRESCGRAVAFVVVEHRGDSSLLQRLAC